MYVYTEIHALASSSNSNIHRLVHAADLVLWHMPSQNFRTDYGPQASGSAYVHVMNLCAPKGWVICKRANGEILINLWVLFTYVQRATSFCNMDFIFFSTIIPLLLLNVVISYDIACQWKINLLDRMTKLPENMHIPVAVATTSFMFGIPKFHASAHDDGCSIPHSLNLMPGVGRTDGEGVERNWSEMNRVANSTKEMGPGARHDTLDDHFGHHNWRKFVGLGKPLVAPSHWVKY